MSTESVAQVELDRCLSLLNLKDYYNGGQTVRDRFPRGSEERARIVAEAALWQAQLATETPGGDA